MTPLKVVVSGVATTVVGTVSHPAVLEAAVIGAEDADGLIKPLACVVVNSSARPSPPWPNSSNNT